jgi:hypothetical protein
MVLVFFWFLIGVIARCHTFLDTAMFPTRGETVLLRAPWITSGLQYAWKNGDTTYIIPRGSGVVVLGGTFQADDWYVPCTSISIVAQRT